MTAIQRMAAVIRDPRQHQRLRDLLRELSTGGIDPQPRKPQTPSNPAGSRQGEKPS